MKGESGKRNPDKIEEGPVVGAGVVLGGLK